GGGGGFFSPPPPTPPPWGAAPAGGRSGAAGGLQATTRVFGQSFGTALVAIAFSVSAAHGPGLALVLGTICAALAVVVNTVRFSKLRAP
ncbi:MFS transporter, partial [Achromobacter xylosoxidans]